MRLGRVRVMMNQNPEYVANLLQQMTLVMLNAFEQFAIIMSEEHTRSIA